MPTPAQINALLYVLWLIVLWLASYQVACWLVALAHRKALVCWSIGPFGVSVVYLREPPPAVLASQVTLPGVAVACASYLGLYALHPLQPASLDLLPLARLGTVLAAGATAAGLQAARVLTDLRFPLWGEARVLACVQRSRALGAMIHFTPAGRAFLRERFGASPREFLRAVG